MARIAATGGLLGGDMRSCLQQVYASPSFHMHSCIHRDQPVQHRQCRVYAGKNVDQEEPDWETEMSIFKKRTLKPSQMEALRKLEEGKVDIGRVCSAICCPRHRQIGSHFPIYTSPTLCF